MTLPPVLRPAARAIRANARAFLVIQALALGLVALYYAAPEFRAAAESVAAAKAKLGLLGSGALTMLAAFGLPELLRRLTRVRPSSPSSIGFQVAFFFVIGMIIDLLYRLLALVVGSGVDVATVVTKVLLDQLIFTPLFSIPFSIAAWRFYECGLDWTRFRATPISWWKGRYPTVLIPCWAFWGPILLLVFALPSSLQFPMFIVVQAAWSLILVHMSQGAEPATA